MPRARNDTKRGAKGKKETAAQKRRKEESPSDTEDEIPQITREEDTPKLIELKPIAVRVEVSQQTESVLKPEVVTPIVNLTNNLYECQLKDLQKKMTDLELQITNNKSELISIKQQLGIQQTSIVQQQGTLSMMAIDNQTGVCRQFDKLSGKLEYMSSAVTSLQVSFDAFRATNVNIPPIGGSDNTNNGGGGWSNNQPRSWSPSRQAHSTKPRPGFSLGDRDNVQQTPPPASKINFVY